MKKICVLLGVLLVFLSLGVVSCADNSAKITSYEITCELTDNILKGRETVNFYNDSETEFSELKFNLFSNAYRENAEYSPVNRAYEYLAYKNGKNYGGITVNSVESAGEALDFSVGGIDRNVLTVSLKESVLPNDSITVSIDYQIIIADVVARLGINDCTINLAEFYPILCGKDKDGFYECVYYSTGDPYFSECADYDVEFTADEKYTVAHAGETLSSKTLDGRTTYRFHLSTARSFCMVLSDKFETLSGSVGNITVNYYYYDDETPIKSLEYALKALKTFGDLYGEYPYSVFSVVETPFVQGGMEFPTIVMISDSVGKESYGEVIVHETAHQWWQTAVGNNEIEYGFLDEGLAEYSTVLFYENNPEYNFTREDLMRISNATYKTFCTVYDRLFGERNTVMARSLKDFTSEYEYVNLAYVKSCIMYDELRKAIGDKAFFGGLKKYYSENKFKIATPYDLKSAFGGVAESFIEGFLSGKAVL